MKMRFTPMTSKNTAIFASAILAVTIAAVGFNTADASPYGYGYDYDHFWWTAQNHRDVVSQATFMEQAWKVGLIDDKEYFWQLVDIYHSESQLRHEFGEFNWGNNPDTDSTKYIKEALKNPIFEKKFEALLATK